MRNLTALLTSIRRTLGRKLRRWIHARELKPLRRSRRNPTAKARVLITGDGGLLGGLVADSLKSDYDIIGFDVCASRRENLGNYKLLRKRMKGCQFVVHAAAIPHPNKGRIEDYFRTNVVGSLNVMRAAEANRTKRFIYFSSVGYYGCNIKGKLLPDYFPIDEAHPTASTEGRAEGRLDAYNQSKVMAEELLAFYGTNRVFEAISLRFAPANAKATQYPAGDDRWREDPRFRRGAFWTNCHPQLVVQAVRAALQAPGEFWYQAFNIADKYSPECIDVKAFMAEEYPDTPCREKWSQRDALFSSAKAERMLGFKPCEDLR